MVSLSDFSHTTLTMLRKAKEDNEGRKEFNPRIEITEVLNRLDGPQRLAGLSYDTAMTVEAIEAAMESSGQRSNRSTEDLARCFWFVVAFATTFATQLPLQKADVDAAMVFLTKFDG